VDDGIQIILGERIKLTSGVYVDNFSFKNVSRHLVVILENNKKYIDVRI
jgi:hypothetical protein